MRVLFFCLSASLLSLVHTSALYKRHDESAGAASETDDASHSAAHSEHDNHPMNGSSSSTASMDQHNSSSHNTSGNIQVCQEYYSAGTSHAVCHGDKSVMCRSGCTGGVFAQNCQLNETSAFSNQTCNVAFARTSATAFLCTTSQGAYTCAGPICGQATCGGCVATNETDSHVSTAGHDGDHASAGGTSSSHSHSTAGSTAVSAGTCSLPQDVVFSGWMSVFIIGALSIFL